MTLNERKWKIGVAVVGWGIALIGVPGAIGFFVDKLQHWITRVTVVSHNNGVQFVAGSYLIAYLPVFIATLLVVSGILSIIWLFICDYDARIELAKIKSDQVKSLAGEAHEKRLAAEANAVAANDNLAAARANFDMQNAYDKMCRAVQRVVFKGYNPVDPTQEPPPRLRFVTIECTFDISADGGAKVTQLYEAEAGDQGARFWTVRLDGDRYAEAFKTLQSIKFEASSLDDSEVEAIPIDNEGFNRSVALFFLPEIIPKTRRKFAIVFDWPGWFGELVQTGVTDWFWSYRAPEGMDTADVIFRFRFANELGSISCEFKRPALNGEILTMSDEGHQRVWTYRHPIHPIKQLDWALRFRKTD